MATSDKYDRQLRLWGASGQRALSRTLVVLVGGSSAAGTETIKNLVLPGVGGFLVVEHDYNDENGDDTMDVDNADHPSPAINPTFEICSPPSGNAAVKFPSFSSNFFVPPPASTDADEKPSTTADSTAARACSHLSELNPDPRGYYYASPQPLDRIDYIALLKQLRQSPPAGETSSLTNILVVSADQPSPVFLPLGRACYDLGAPLLIVRSYGLLGYVRVQAPSPYHFVADSKPANKIADLRLSAWPVFEGLAELAKSFDEGERKQKELDKKNASGDNNVGSDEAEGEAGGGGRVRVPYAVILLRALDEWRDTLPPDAKKSTSSPPRFPKTFPEKTDFRNVVKGMVDNIQDERNYEEALREAHAAWADGRISCEVRDVLDRAVATEDDFFQNAVVDKDTLSDAEGSNAVSASLLRFQMLCLALRRYLAAHDDYPPLEGTIPDMASDTASYVALQGAYRKRAAEDRSDFEGEVRRILEECREKAADVKTVLAEMPSDEDIATFCKNARNLRLLETRPFYEEYRRQDPSGPAFAAASCSEPTPLPPSIEALFADARDDLLSSAMDPHESDPVQTPLVWYIALRACDAFRDRHGRYPGVDGRALALESDAKEVHGHMVSLCANLGLTVENCELVRDTVLDDTVGMNVAREVVRYDEAEIHAVAAVVGGVASQEAVKLIAGQYVPLDDAYVYNGIASTAGVYRF